jgi:hypothetical protein
MTTERSVYSLRLREKREKERTIPIGMITLLLTVSMSMKRWHNNILVSLTLINIVGVEAA